MKIKSSIIISGIFFIFAVLFITGTLQAEGKKRIAVLNFTATNAPDNLALGVRELTEVSLYQTELFDILERSQIKQILVEQDLQETRCEDTSCGVRIGKLLSTDMVILGSVVKLDAYTITIKYIGVKNAKVVLADSETAESESEIRNKVNLLIDRSAKKAQEIINKDLTVLNPAKEKRIVEPGLFYLLGFVPGAAQAYSGHPGKGVFFFSMFTLSAVGIIYSYDYYKEKKHAYKNASYYNTSKEKFDELYKDYKIASNILIYTAGVCGLIYILNWFDVIFLSKPDFDKQVSGINIFDKNVTLNIYNKPDSNSIKNLNLSLGADFNLIEDIL